MNDIYAYFDGFGVLRERITAPIREGATGCRIYAYMEKDVAASVGAFFRVAGNGSWVETATEAKSQTIPANYTKGKDLRYFDPTKVYPFRVATVPSALLTPSGTRIVEFRYNNSLPKTFVTGSLSFYVQGGEAEIGSNITLDQYDYLMEEYESTLSLINSKSKVYALTEGEGGLANDGFNTYMSEFTIPEGYAIRYATPNGYAEADPNSLRAGDVVIPNVGGYPPRAVVRYTDGGEPVFRSLCDMASAQSAQGIASSITINGTDYRTPVTYIVTNWVSLGFNSGADTSAYSATQIDVVGEADSHNYITGDDLRVGDMLIGTSVGVGSVKARYVRARYDNPDRAVLTPIMTV